MLFPELLQKQQAVNLWFLGDSYTKGEGIPTTHAYPFLVKRMLTAHFTDIRFELNLLAETGWQTMHLLDAINASTAHIPYLYDVIALCIGVNDAYDGVSINTFCNRFEHLVAIVSRHVKSNGILLLANIPNYGFSPRFLQQCSQIEQLLCPFNDFISAFASNKVIPLLDFYKHSAYTETTYYASDGLHPSEKMYKIWANEMVVNHLIPYLVHRFPNPDMTRPV